MKYVMTFTDSSRQILLGDDDTVESVSSECRQAAVAFMSGVASGWDKLDLAFWLTGPYARAVRHTRHGERVTALASAPSLEEPTVERLLAHVHEDLLGAIVVATHRDGALEFAEPAVEMGHVRKALDADGVGVWVPVDRTRMRLVDRVRSLFTADYLNAPDAYAELFVCAQCGGLVFDGSGKRVGLCAAHRRHSGIVFRDGEVEGTTEIPIASADSA